MRATITDRHEIPEAYDTHFDLIRADTPGLLDRVYRLRYQVYCVENPFEDPAQNVGEREVDADDERAAHVLLLHRKSGGTVGTARVIFPDLSRPRPLPIERILDSDGQVLFHCLPRETTGEVSRFAVSKAFRRRHGEERYADIGSGATRQSWLTERRTMPFITFGLMRGIFGICLERGITHLTAVMEPALIRLLGRFGLDFQPIGGVVEYHGMRQPCAASIHDLVRRASDERSLLWLYAKEEIVRRGELVNLHPTLGVQTRVAMSKFPRAG